MSLATQIEILRPERLLFGSGLVGEVGAYARALGVTRILVVADAFNAARASRRSDRARDTDGARRTDIARMAGVRKHYTYMFKR